MATIESMNVKLGINTKPFARGSKMVTGQIQLMRSKVDRLDSALSKLGKGTGLAILASSLTQVTAAAAPAAGAVLALPAAAAAAGAAFGTLAVATSGMGDAFKAVAEGDAEKLKEALKGLPPEARGVVRAYQGINDEFKDIRRNVQSAFFEDLGDRMEKVAGKVLPVLDRGMGSVADSMNLMAKRALAAMETPFFRGALADTFDATAKSTKTFSGAVKPLMNTIAGLVKVGLPFLDSLAQWAKQGLKASAAFVKSEKGAAKLEQMIRTAGRVLQQLGSIAVNLGKTLGGIFGAANSESAGLLAKLERMTAKVAQWVNSAKGQEQIAATFRVLNEVAARTALILGTVVTVVMRVVQWINSLPPGVRNVITTFLAWTVATAFIGSKLRLIIGIMKLVGKGALLMATKVIPAFMRISLAVGKATVQILAKTGKILARWALLGVRALLMAARVAASWIIAMGPIGWVIGIVVGLVALIIANWKTVKKWTGRIFGWVADFAVSIWNRIAQWIGNQVDRILSVIGWLRRIPGKVRRFFGRARKGAVSALKSLVQWVRRIPQRILGALGNTGKMLWNAGRDIIKGLIDGIESAFGWLKDKLDYVTGIIPDWKGPLSEDKKLLTPAGEAIMDGLVGGIDGKLGELRKTLGGVTGEISGVGAGAATPHVRGAGRMRGREPARVVLDVDGADEDMKRMIRKMVRVDGGGDVQVALGR